MPTQGAMHACCAVWYFGFCFLPWLWFTNVWLFWYDFVGRPGADPALKKCEFHIDVFNMHRLDIIRTCSAGSRNSTYHSAACAPDTQPLPMTSCRHTAVSSRVCGGDGHLPPLVPSLHHSGQAGAGRRRVQHAGCHETRRCHARPPHVVSFLRSSDPRFTA